MTVAYRSGASIVNTTAGTSVVVGKPTGTVDGDFLLATITEVGTGAITAPAGWTLIGSQAASTSVTMATYWRVASSEPASWTWTLGASTRNIGRVGAYTGVNLTAPITEADPATYTSAVTVATGDSAVLRHGGLGVTIIGAVRGTGSATTWTTSGTERADLSTASGSGTNISLCVMETTWLGEVEASYAGTGTASQSQTAAALWTITLAPAFIGPAAGDWVCATVEAAFGAADPYADPATLTWTDISAAVRPGITIEPGLPQGATSLGVIAPPTSLRLILNDPAGDFTPDNPAGQYYPNIVDDVPIRVTVPYGYGPPTQRAYCWVESWTPSWDDSADHGITTVTAYGAMNRIGANLRGQQVRSALYRALSGLSPISGVATFAYWPGEDESDATQIASAYDQLPLDITPGVSMGSASDLPGSAPLPTLGDGDRIDGASPPYEPTGQWCWVAAVKMPVTPVAASSVLMRVSGPGTAKIWQLVVEPGTPDALRIQCYTGETLVLDNSVVLTEAAFYGQWVLLHIGAKNVGSNISYVAGYVGMSSGQSMSGTVVGRSIRAARRVAFLPNASLAGLAVGHIGLYIDPAYDIVNDPTTLALRELDGRVGDLPHYRFQDLCTAAGIRHDFEPAAGATQIPMGPLPITTLSGALEECPASDQGIIHDAGPDGQLIMVTRSSLYNQAPTITVSVDSRQLAPPFAPTYTSRGRFGDSTVTRAGGSSGRYVDPDQASPRFDDITLSLQTDTHLVPIAGWRVGVSSTPGMRYPSVTIDLRGSPELTQPWLDVRPAASRVRITDMWAAHGTDDVEQIITGWTETITGDRWDAVMHCLPAAPYDIAVLEASDDTVFRADTAVGTVLASGVAAGATTLSVTTPAGALLTTAGSDYPVDLDVEGERMTAAVIGQALNTDPFLTAGNAAAWIGSNASVAYSVAQQRHPSWGSLLVTPSASDAQARPAARSAVSASTQYLATAWVYSPTGWASGHRVGINWHTAVSGGSYISTSFGATVSPVSAGVWTLLTAAVTSPGTAVAALLLVAQLGTPTPGDAWYTTGITIVPASTTTASPQAVTVIRGVGGYAAAHPAGAPLRLWRPRRPGL